MPINPRNYPLSWKRVIVPEIRTRSRNECGKEQCECRVECLKHIGRCDMLLAILACERAQTVPLPAEVDCHQSSPLPFPELTQGLLRDEVDGDEAHELIEEVINAEL